MNLTDKAYNTLTLLKRANFLMSDYPNDASDKDIKEVCEEIYKYLNEQEIK
jgi:hypothetical protein